MADTAFLRLVNENHDQKITYLRFHRVDQSNEELNCVALGNWPKPGCVIISPWLSKKPITWQGNINDTPEIKKECYDIFYQICQVLPKERAIFQHQIRAGGYDQWLKSDKRKVNLTQIQESADRFYQGPSQFLPELEITKKVSATH